MMTLKNPNDGIKGSHSDGESTNAKCWQQSIQNNEKLPKSQAMQFNAMVLIHDTV
jgi:hypothetical protein